MLFYLVRTPKGELVLSPFPELDKPYFEGGSFKEDGKNIEPYTVLTPGVPLAYLETVAVPSESILRALAREDVLKSFPWHWGDLEYLKDYLPGVVVGPESREPNVEIVKSLRGRKLTEDELRMLATSYGLKPEEVWQQAHLLVRAGLGEWVPAVRRERKGWRCQRCGESELEEWPSIYGAAFTCPSCRSLGTSSTLKVIYRDLRTPARENFALRSLNKTSDLVLTPAQEKAAGQVLEFVQSTLESEALLWAACGAGKTEVCFPAATWALGQGKSVLFAAPRQDVIHDVAPRLQQAFPDLSIPVLSGASAAKFSVSDLVLATTHQVLRFYQAFDLIFLDELDAFPYRDSRMLQWGVTQALRPGGKILFLSATPDPATLKRIRKEGKIIRLPARHHRRPLPVPVFKKMPDWSRVKDSGSLLSKMQPGFGSMLAALREHGPVIFFVPKISSVNVWTEILKSIFPGWSIAGSYSRDPERLDKLVALRRGDFDLFVATSILERGVTIAGAQVAVMAADHPVFDERALVQMAGRAGRTRANPSGGVIFFAARETAAIRTAVRWINEQNELARTAGLLD